MAWTIILVRALTYVINLSHNSIFRLSEEQEFIHDIYAA